MRDSSTIDSSITESDSVTTTSDSPAALSVGSAPVLLAGLLLLGLMVAGVWINAWTARDARDAASQLPPLVVSKDARGMDVAVGQRIEALKQIERQVQAIEADTAGKELLAPVRDQVPRLAELQPAVSDPSADGVKLRHYHEELRQMWRDSLGVARTLLRSPPPPLPELPPLQDELLGQDRRARGYRGLYHNLEARIGRLDEARVKSFDDDLTELAGHVSTIMMLRYQVLHRLHKLGSRLLLESPGTWMDDVGLELHSYELRKSAMFLLTLARYRQLSGGGTAMGWSVAWDAGLALFSLLLLPTVMAVGRRATRGRPPGVRGMLGWSCAWVMCRAAHLILGQTLAEALRPVADLAAWYAACQVFFQLAQGPVLEAIASSSLGRVPGVRTRARNTFQLVAKFLFFQGSLALLAFTVGGYGILALSVSDLLELLFLLLYAILSWQWRTELAFGLRHMLGGPVGRLLAPLCQSRLGAVVVAPLAVPVVTLLAVTHTLLIWITSFEGFTWLTPYLLNYDSDASTSDSELSPVPASYRTLFLEEPLAHDLDPAFLEQVDKAVKSWLTGGEQPSLILPGYYGADRAGIAAALQRRYAAWALADSSPDCRVAETLLLSLEERTLRSSELVAALARAFSLSLTPPDLDGLARVLADRPPTLVIVPHSQRFFLATVGGFEGLRALDTLMARCQSNLFWLLLTPSSAWRYLGLALPTLAPTKPALPLPTWSDQALATLLKGRRDATKLPHRFSNSVLRAAERTSGLAVEDFFFSTLRQLSRGQALVAQELWLKAARLDPQGNVVISLPGNPVSRLMTLTQASAFFLAAILRHEDLTLEEAARATDLPFSDVYLICERCRQMGLVELGPDRRLRLSYLWCADVVYYLKERHLDDGR